MSAKRKGGRPSGDDRGFPADLVWGAATSAYQIEGSPLADGAGPSIRHRFCHTPGRVRGGANAPAVRARSGSW